MQEFIENEITTEENKPMVSYFWKGLALFLLGVIVGILFAPIKKGVSIGNNNNIVGKDDDEDCFENCCGDRDNWEDWDEYSEDPDDDEGIKF